VELALTETSLKEEKIRLLEGLVGSLEQLGRMKGEEPPSNLLFEIYSMNRNNMSKVFSDSATWVDPEFVNPLLEEGIIQRVASADSEKYALTFKGIAQCIKLKYGTSLEEQFLNFLELSDRKFTTANRTELQWREKLASLSLILMGSTSESSAIRLSNEVNKAVLTQVFEKTLVCLKKFGIVEKDAKLSSTQRGESPVSALMSRLNALPRKTNHYYKNIEKESGYFFDIEKDGAVDEKKLLFLFRRIFEHYDSNCNYAGLERELAEISQSYSPRFLARSTNSTVAFSILKGLKGFMGEEIWRLPPQ